MAVLSALSPSVEKQPEEISERVVRMSYAEYLALPDNIGIVEYIDGETIFHMPPNTEHQSIAQFLASLMGLFAEFFKLGKVLPTPIEVKLPNGNSREPDIVFVGSSQADIVKDARIEGAPNLVIEIVSPESVKRDYDEKFVEYQEAGVKEYWVIDPRPRRMRVSFFQRSEQGELKPVPDDTNGIYRSNAVPNFWLYKNWIWERPDVQLAFAEIVDFPENVVEAIKKIQRENSSAQNKSFNSD